MPLNPYPLPKFLNKSRFSNSESDPNNLRKVEKNINLTIRGSSINYNITGNESVLDNHCDSEENIPAPERNLCEESVFDNFDCEKLKNHFLNMTNPNIVTPSDVFNNLRVPDAIKDLPVFDGNSRLLFDFLDNVEEILSLIAVTNNTPYGQLLLRTIRNKIVGPANEVLNMYGTPLVWQQIKQNLILHYSDKRNETSLIRDLHKAKQGSNTIEKFYSEIIELFASMTNHVNIHETDENVIRAKKQLYSEMCLNAFLSGLKEPIGSIIGATKPTFLAEAFSYCIKEQNILYVRNDNNNKPPTTPKPLIGPNNHFYSQPDPLIQRQTFAQNFGFNQPRNPPKPLINPNPFRNQSPFHSPNFQQQRNLQHYNRPPQRNLPKPEPMDATTTSARLNQPQQPSRAPSNNFFRSTGPPNFTSKELFNLSEGEFHPNQLHQEQYLEGCTTQVNP